MANVAYWLTTTIKKKYFEDIKSGKKKVEYKIISDHWKQRIESIRLQSFIDFNEYPEIGICFICGQEVHRRTVVDIRTVKSLYTKKIDEVYANSWYEIHLGDEIDG
jgi:ASC-1-like (ASCH) protein